MEARSRAFISSIKISVISDKNCGFFLIDVDKNFNFGPKIQILITPTFFNRIKKYFRTQSVYLREYYGKNLVWKFRPTWAANVANIEQLLKEN